MSESNLPMDSVPTTPGMDPNAQPHDARSVAQLEGRLQFVEDAYMSLRQFVQELQNIQSSQDKAMSWMRDRIDQLTDAGTPRDVMTSPPIGQIGVVPSKRKAEYSPSETREWSRRPPPEHSSVYSRHGPVSSGAPSSSSSLAQGSSQGAQSPRGRYEPPPNFQFNPPHQPAPRTPPSQHQQLPPQQQQTPQGSQGQRQHPSPPMGSSHPHYQKASIPMLHD
ncbi:hypothetical protein BGX31_006928 [Mortierella sp. GBA43]|nr:hypothetical protein BGX31_006928 [Mortierella sp. GBA43]